MWDDGSHGGFGATNPRVFKCLECGWSLYWGFHSHGDTPKWMFNKGKPHLQMDDLGVNLFMETLIWIWLKFCSPGIDCEPEDCRLWNFVRNICVKSHGFYHFPYPYCHKLGVHLAFSVRVQPFRDGFDHVISSCWRLRSPRFRQCLAGWIYPLFWGVKAMVLFKTSPNIDPSDFFGTQAW